MPLPAQSPPTSPSKLPRPDLTDNSRRVVASVDERGSLCIRTPLLCCNPLDLLFLHQQPLSLNFFQDLLHLLPHLHPHTPARLYTVLPDCNDSQLTSSLITKNRNSPNYSKVRLFSCFLRALAVPSCCHIPTYLASNTHSEIFSQDHIPTYHHHLTTTALPSHQRSSILLLLPERCTFLSLCDPITLTSCSCT